jgi:rod shape-determining protein MreD
MRNLVAVPVILLTVILQSAVISRVYLLSGIADLPLVMLAAWSLQEEVDSAWHWAAATGLLVGFVSEPAIGCAARGVYYNCAPGAHFQRRVWQAPLLAMFTITFLGTIIVSGLSLGVLRFAGCLPSDVLGLLTLPSVLLNMLLAIPLLRSDAGPARWVYPTPEVE